MRWKFAAVWAAAFAVGGCGGGSEEGTLPKQQAQTSSVGVDSAAAAAPMQAGATKPGRSTDGAEAVQLFSWAERHFPELFASQEKVPSSPMVAVAYEGSTYYAKYFARSGNYLAVSDGIAYALGPLTGHQLQGFGPVAELECKLLGSNCPPPPRNECTSPNALVEPPVGTVEKLIYEYSGSAPGRVSVTATYEGIVEFNGRQARRTTLVSTGRLMQVSRGTNRKEFEMRAHSVEHTVVQGDRIVTLGSETETVMREIVAAGPQPAEVVTRTTSVYPEGLPDIQFGLQRGQKITQTVPRTFSQSAPTVVPATTGPFKQTFEYASGVHSEPLGGVSVDVCKYYRTASDGSVEISSYRIGHGTLVRQQASGLDIRLVQ